MSKKQDKYKNINTDNETKTGTKTGTPAAQDPARDPAPVPVSVPEVVNEIEYNCLDIAADYIAALDDPAQISDNNGIFVDMLKDIYSKYLVYVLDNTHGVNNRYDYKQLDKVFNAYTRLVYKYKKNKRPNILEFCIFTNLNRQTLYNAIYNHTKKLSDIDIQYIKNWFTECENALVNGSGVFEIFLLKSQYRYNDNLSPIPIDSQGPALTVNELPDLTLSKIAKKDPDNGST